MPEDLLFVLRDEAHLTSIHSSKRFRGKRCHLHEPLVLHLRLDHRVALVATLDHIAVALVDGNKKTLLLKLVDDLRPCLRNLESLELTGNRKKLSAPIDNLFHIEFMALGNLEVDPAVPGGDGH